MPFCFRSYATTYAGQDLFSFCLFFFFFFLTITSITLLTYVEVVGIPKTDSASVFIHLVFAQLCFRTRNALFKLISFSSPCLFIYLAYYSCLSSLF